MEKTILEKLGWNLMFKTTADYLEIFLVQGVVFSNDSIIENCYLH